MSVLIEMSSIRRWRDEPGHDSFVRDSQRRNLRFCTCRTACGASCLQTCYSYKYTLEAANIDIIQFSRCSQVPRLGVFPEHP